MLTPRHQKVPFSLPDIGQQEIDAVVECLRSGWLTTGSRCVAFEQDFTRFVGGDVESLAVSSCTAGLEIALAAFGIGEGDEVITSDFTFSATAMSIVHVGAKPVLADIDPSTLNIDIAKIESLITPRTKAIIPVHYAGLACDMTAIGDIARRHGLRVIEDAAHALPTTWNGRIIGNATSDASVFSFYATKTITTGEGGMITFADPAVAKRARTLRLHGIDRDIFARYSAAGSNSWGYEIVARGYKSNLTDIAAALGIVQLKRAWDFYKRRSALVDIYDAALAELPIVRPPRAPSGDVHASHLYAIRLNSDAAISRDAFIVGMAEAGVNCSVHFIPLHRHSYWRSSLGVSAGMFPHSQQAFEQLVTLPLFNSMTDSVQAYVIEAARRLLA
ncbi:pyridoxal phosphate-dependent aminotransferase [Bradyrhizobium sp. CCBAU 53415]|nr:pyridoxal phosphate-dependent aminotransferase [Bradyrhizobium sp. CCBAU 53415]